jgi:ubiquitin-conjugating enzyme E2 S
MYGCLVETLLSAGYFLTKIFHPNVSLAGDICVNTLKKDWTPDTTLSHVLSVIRCLLIVPFPESALNEEAGKAFMESYDDYVRKARLWTSIHAAPTPAAARARGPSPPGAAAAASASSSSRAAAAAAHPSASAELAGSSSASLEDGRPASAASAGVSAAAPEPGVPAPGSALAEQSRANITAASAASSTGGAGAAGDKKKADTGADKGADAKKKKTLKRL